MSRKKATTGIETIQGEQVGLVKIVQEIGAVFNTEFNDVEEPPVFTYYLHVFNLAIRAVNAEGEVYPAATSLAGGALTDYFDLRPSERLAGLLFFDYSDPIKYLQDDQYARSQFSTVVTQVPLALVFHFNFERQQYTQKWSKDYRIGVEAMRLRILEILTKKLVGKISGILTVEQTFSRSVEDCYKGYKVTSSEQYAAQPYGCFRFECVLTFRSVCPEEEEPEE